MKVCLKKTTGMFCQREKDCGLLCFIFINSVRFCFFFFFFFLHDGFGLFHFVLVLHENVDMLCVMFTHKCDNFVFHMISLTFMLSSIVI